MKKVFSLVLSMLLVFTIFALPVSASNTLSDPNVSIEYFDEHGNHLDDEIVTKIHEVNPLLRYVICCPNMNTIRASLSVHSNINGKNCTWNVYSVDICQSCYAQLNKTLKSTTVHDH